MKKRYVDPFTPDLPVDSPDRFAGRKKEIDSVVDSLYQLNNSNPRHSIITGDRGIGKSSVLVQVKNIAKGNDELAEKLELDLGDEDYDFICAWHDCSTDQTPAIVASQLLKQLKSSFETVFSKIKLELNLGGILSISQKDSPNKSSLTEIVDLFCTDIKKASAKANENDKSGIILFIDELDRVKQNSGMATFLKLSAEKLSREGIKNVAFFAAGITGAIQNLEEDHGSIYRTFKDVPLPRLKLYEVEEILKNGFDSVSCTYDDKILKGIFDLSAGYPEPVHLLGSQLLKTDDDGHLTQDDLNNAKIEVIETLRRNKLASMLKNAGSGKYQQILKAMSKYDGVNVPLNFISDEIGFEQNQYSTNMSNLKERNIISQVDRGVYCFVDPLLKEYIARFGVIDSSND